MATDRPADPLILIGNARGTLQSLAFTFYRMTDRHDDGPAAQRAANELIEANKQIVELVAAARALLKEGGPHPLERLRKAVEPFGDTNA
jgi:hypothetical protein